jgi:hypothetical protein
VAQYKSLAQATAHAMAQVRGNNIGLIVPGRLSTPCNGRIQVRLLDWRTWFKTDEFHQHYSRPGNPMQQATRTYSNGTTLTFGPEVRPSITCFLYVENADQRSRIS